MKRISTTDIMATGLTFIGFYILTITLNFLQRLGEIVGAIGATVLIISQVVYLWQTKIRKLVR